MPRYAKKGTTVADIGQKMFELLAAARREYIEYKGFSVIHSNKKKEA